MENEATPCDIKTWIFTKVKVPFNLKIAVSWFSENIGYVWEKVKALVAAVEKFEDVVAADCKTDKRRITAYKKLVK